MNLTPNILYLVSVIWKYYKTYVSSEVTRVTDTQVLPLFYLRYATWTLISFGFLQVRRWRPETQHQLPVSDSDVFPRLDSVRDTADLEQPGSEGKLWGCFYSIALKEDRRHFPSIQTVISNFCSPNMEERKKKDPDRLF